MKRQGAEHDLYTFVNIHLDPSYESPEQATPMGPQQSPMVDPHSFLSILSITRVGMGG